MGNEVIAELPITPQNFFYWYKAWVKRVVDGDTIYLDSFDFGRKHYEDDVSLRFCNPDGSKLDTWETKPRGIPDEAKRKAHITKGLKAKEYVESVLKPGDEIVVLTNRDESGTFRDLVGAVFVPQGDGTYLDISVALAEKGHLKA